MNIIYWLIRIVCYYVMYENLQFIDNAVTFIVTLVVFYYTLNFIFKQIDLFMTEIEK